MKIPSPDYKQYISSILTVLATVAALQYTGLFFGNSGGIDFWYLLMLGTTLSVAYYGWLFTVTNVERLPEWETMVRSGE